MLKILNLCVLNYENGDTYRKLSFSTIAELKLIHKIGFSEIYFLGNIGKRSVLKSVTINSAIKQTIKLKNG